MSEQTDLNEGVQIILNRMKTNPEEFFDNGGRWSWIFKDTLREVMTEIEKAALYEGLKHVRRVEITAKAAATVLRADEREEQTLAASTGTFAYDKMRMASAKPEGGSVTLNVPPKRSMKDLL